MTCKNFFRISSRLHFRNIPDDFRQSSNRGLRSPLSDASQGLHEDYLGIQSWDFRVQGYPDSFVLKRITGAIRMMPKAFLQQGTPS
jgi:hypothetical protein